MPLRLVIQHQDYCFDSVDTHLFANKHFFLHQTAAGFGFFTEGKIRLNHSKSTLRKNLISHHFISGANCKTSVPKWILK